MQSSDFLEPLNTGSRAETRVDSTCSVMDLKTDASEKVVAKSIN